MQKEKEEECTEGPKKESKKRAKNKYMYQLTVRKNQTRRKKRDQSRMSGLPRKKLKTNTIQYTVALIILAS